MYTIDDRTLALAGIFQAAQLTWQVARRGQADSLAMETSIYSLFQANPPSTEAVFGGLRGVAPGLRCLLRQLEGNDSRNLEITQYSIALIALARRLRKEPARLEALGESLARIEQRQQQFEFSDEIRYSQLANLYQEQISALSPRIMVRGEPAYLENRDNAARIRTALLAGIRAAILWFQCGGSRWQLLIQRRKHVESAKKLLQKID